MERFEDVGHPSLIPVERFGKSGETAAAIEGAQGLRPLVGTHGDQAIRPGRKLQSFGTERLQKLGTQRSHIAGDDQIPFGCGVPQSRFHSGERAQPGPQIGDHGETQRTVFVRASDQCRIAGSLSDDRGDALRQSNAARIEQGFVRAHPRAVAAGQHVTGYAHSRMITLGFAPMSRFVTSFGLLAVFSAASLAAEEIPSARTTLVVRTDAKSGRLVRSVVVTPKVISPKPADEPEPPAVAEPAQTGGSLIEMIDSIAAKNDVEAPLVHSVIQAESNYNPLAVSPKGAQGLMQLIPSTARRFGVSNSFNPQQNIEGGVKYLKFLMELYHNDYVKVIAAYNAGEGAVTKYGGIPPYAETRSYVYQVGKNLVNARKAAEANKPAPKPAEPKPSNTGEQFHPIQALTGPDGKLYYKTQ